VKKKTLTKTKKQGDSMNKYAFEKRFDKPYKRKYVDEFGDADVLNCFDYMLEPENITTFFQAFSDLTNYFVEYDERKGEEYYHPIFQEWFDSEVAENWEWKKIFKSQQEEFAENLGKAKVGLKEMTSEQILKVSGSCDGHTILITEKLIEDGLHKDVASYLHRRRWSDKSHYKSSLYDNDGRSVDFIEGIYGATLLYFIADNLNLEYESKMGRGSQAFAIRDAINKHFKKK